MFNTFYSWESRSTAVHYNITGSEPYHAVETIYLVYDKPSTTISLSYNANGGSNAPAAQSQSTTTGSANFTISSQTPAKEGYEFLGWADTNSAASANYQAGDTLALSSNKMLYAVWKLIPEAQKFTLTYKDGDQTLKTETYTEGEDATINYTPTKDGYTFLGWSSSSEAITADWENGDTMRMAGNNTLYAVWKKNPTVYTVTYTDGVKGEELFADQTHQVEEGANTPAFNGAPVREGYTFAGWAPAVAETVTANATYTATWTKNDPVVDPEQPEDPKPGEKTNHPTIEKKIDGNVQSVNPGETINYTLTSNVPDYLGKYLPVKDKEDNVLRPAGEFKLVIHDDIDNGLTVNHDSVKVTIKNNDVPNQYYTIEQNVECKDEKICDFHISMDLVKLYEAGIIDLEDIRNAEKIVVTYSATVSEEIKPGSYHNTAWVTYTGDGTSEPDDPDVDVYGIYLKKVDQDNPDKVLAGAEFELYAADKITKLGSAVSGENGIAKFDVSLKAGTYYVKETKSPEGYVASSDFIKIEITENDLTVETDEKSELYFYKGTEVPNVSVPETGGTGTDTLYMTGAGVIAAAGLIYFISRRRRTE